MKLWRVIPCLVLWVAMVWVGLYFAPDPDHGEITAYSFEDDRTHIHVWYEDGHDNILTRQEFRKVSGMRFLPRPPPPAKEEEDDRH